MGSLSPDNFVVNNGVLATAHSIFSRYALASLSHEILKLSSRWRSQFRTDRLFSEINFVLDRFCEPYFQLFGHVDTLLASQTLDAATQQSLASKILLMVELFHDLSAQDLPPFIEDHMRDFMGGGGKEGWLRKYLSWETPELKGDVSRLAESCWTLLTLRRMTRLRDRYKRFELPSARSLNCTP